MPACATRGRHLGSDAYTVIRAALVDRIAALGAQRAFARSTDFEEQPPASADAAARDNRQGEHV